MIEASRPARPATGKAAVGDIESLNVDIAENGYTARVSRKVAAKAGKGGDSYPSYNSETFVFPTAGKLLTFLRKELKAADAEEAAEPADGDE